MASVTLTTVLSIGFGLNFVLSVLRYIKMLRLFVFSLVVATAVGASVESKCPEVKPVENFNLTAYQGVWYEISKIPIASQGKGQCAQAEYTVEGDLVKVKNSHVLNGDKSNIEGTAKFAPDANNSASLLVSFKFGDVVTESPLLVLATDYTHYAITYNCKNDTYHAWVLSRTKTLEGDAKTAVDTFLKDNAKIIDSSKLIATDFSEAACKFNTTSVMTEQVAKP